MNAWYIIQLFPSIILHGHLFFDFFFCYKFREGVLREGLRDKSLKSRPPVTIAFWDITARFYINLLTHCIKSLFRVKQRKSCIRGDWTLSGFEHIHTFYCAMILKLSATIIAYDIQKCNVIRVPLNLTWCTQIFFAERHVHSIFIVT